MYSSPHSLTLALDGGEWSVSRPGRFTPRERAPGTHRMGGWMVPRTVLDAVVKRKIPSPRRESNSDRPARSLALYRLSYHGSWGMVMHERKHSSIYHLKYKIMWYSSVKTGVTFNPCFILSHIIAPSDKLDSLQQSMQQGVSEMLQPATSE
jgi:hypothetical protein